MNSNFLILLLSFVAFLYAANIENSAPKTLSAQERFFDNKGLLLFLSEFLYLHPSIRLITNNFKAIHDQRCALYLSKIDPRLKNYLINTRTDTTDGRSVPSLICPTLKQEIPLHYLFSEYSCPAVMIPKSVAQIESGEEEDDDDVTLRRAEVAEGRRVIEYAIKALTENEIKYPRFRLKGRQYLLYAFILAMNCFDPSELSHFRFRLSNYLIDSVRGQLPEHFGEIIVRSFDTDFSPELVHEALKSGRVDFARIILNKPNASPILATYSDPSSGATTLHYCASMGAVDLIDRCLEMGASPFISDNSNSRPIHYAVTSGQLEATKRLLEFDQDINVSTLYHLSVIERACYSGRSDIMELFLSKPDITLIGNPSVSKRMADYVLDSNNASMAKVIFESGKLELSEEIMNLLYHLSLRKK